MLLAEQPIQSLEVPEMYFGYTYHSLLIPPFPVRSMLILGYGNGSVAHLVDRIWPQVHVEGVDTEEPKDSRADEMWLMDAYKFVKGCGKTYDYVVVDLFNSRTIPGFVFKKDFIVRLREITEKILAVNATFHKWDDFKDYHAYFNLDCVKQVNEDRVMFFNTRSK